MSKPEQKHMCTINPPGRNPIHIVVNTSRGCRTWFLRLRNIGYLVHMKPGSSFFGAHRTLIFDLASSAATTTEVRNHETA
jgi:hypothetical protein